MPSPTDRTHAPRVSKLPSAFSLQPSASRRAFTLTELLIVITIIAILAGLGSYAAVQALGTAKQTQLKTELDSIDAAFKAYKEKYGSYPPCNLANTAAVQAHIARAFPRYNISNLAGDLAKAGVDTTNFRPDQALVFWLQGFSPDPANPFITPSRLQISGGTITGTTPLAVTPLFQFDTTRLWQVQSVAGGGASAVISPTSTAAAPPLASYYPQGLVPPSSSAAPYLYWEPLFYGTPPTIPTTEALPNGFNTTGLQIFTNAGVSVPYWSDLNGNGTTKTTADANENWVNPDSFQLIGPGMDGKYGNVAGTVVRLYPTGTNYDSSNLTVYCSSSDFADDDNVTNFCAKSRLGDAKP